MLSDQASNKGSKRSVSQIEEENSVNSDKPTHLLAIQEVTVEQRRASLSPVKRVINKEAQMGFGDMQNKIVMKKGQKIEEKAPKIMAPDKATAARKQLEVFRLGKMSEARSTRPSSTISVINTSLEQQAINHKTLLQSHILAGEDPLSWNNIPKCIALAMDKVILSAVKSDQSIFNY